jgi:hypothetical protein
VKPWLRYGLIFGVAAGVATILVNVLGSLNRPADICVTGKGNLTLTLTGLLLFLAIAGAAGWQTTRTGSKVTAAALAGLVTGAVSGLPVLVGFLLSLDLAVRVVHCPNATRPIPSDDVVRAIGVILALVIVLIGMGVGAAAGAAGGAIGERRETA